MENQSMTRLATFTLAIALIGLAAPVGARDTFHDLDVEQAVEEGSGRENLRDLPFYMKGQKHPAVLKEIGDATSNRRTNAFNKSDEKACQIAFLSAIIALQAKAQDMGGDAVVEIRSITKHNDLESATQYRCVAGNVVANVALEGRVVKFKK
jgi:uncharacterized protein YbjQ (UPF0145 family)